MNQPTLNGTQRRLPRIIHIGRTAGRERCRNGANPSNGKLQSAQMNLINMATEVPALQAFAWSGLHLE
jgi:hypothetical protein